MRERTFPTIQLVEYIQNDAFLTFLKKVNQMNGKQTLKLSGLFVGLILSAGFGNANSQPAAPTETKGVTQKLLATHDLGPEIEGMAGRQLRL